MRTITLLAALTLAGCCGPGDAACTQAQYNAIGAAMMNQPVYYNQPMPMITTSCTRAGCLSF